MHATTSAYPGYKAATKRLRGLDRTFTLSRTFAHRFRHM